MIRFSRLLFPAMFVLISACGASPDVTVDVRPVETPAAPGSGQPSLAVGDDGMLYLSWIEPAGEGHALRFAVWEDSGWSAARTIATGEDWFVNWADFPSLAAAGDGTLLAHWLQKRGTATYAYDVMLSLSRDGGASWSEPFSPHDDGTRTEHGFVSLVPRPDRSFEVLWLDGRETVAGEDGEPAGTGVMTLRSARVDREGRIADGRLIDERVCDCCSTDAVIEATGTLVAVYRDRSRSEIRDISVARLGPEGWVAGETIHEDRWEIAACPVNGPALATSGDGLACAWFTAPHETGIVNVAFSTDGGLSFAAPLRVDTGQPVGRVDLAMVDDTTAVVSWLEEGTIWLRWLSPAGPLTDPIPTATTDSSRASGVPRLIRFKKGLFLAWTQTGPPSRVRTARLPD